MKCLYCEQELDDNDVEADEDEACVRCPRCSAGGPLACRKCLPDGEADLVATALRLHRDAEERFDKQIRADENAGEAQAVGGTVKRLTLKEWLGEVEDMPEGHFRPHPSGHVSAHFRLLENGHPPGPLRIDVGYGTYPAKATRAAGNLASRILDLVECGDFFRKAPRANRVARIEEVLLNANAGYRGQLVDLLAAWDACRDSLGDVPKRLRDAVYEARVFRPRGARPGNPTSRSEGQTPDNDTYRERMMAARAAVHGIVAPELRAHMEWALDTLQNLHNRLSLLAAPYLGLKPRTDPDRCLDALREGLDAALRDATIYAENYSPKNQMALHRVRERDPSPEASGGLSGTHYDAPELDEDSLRRALTADFDAELERLREAQERAPRFKRMPDGWHATRWRVGERWQGGYERSDGFRVVLDGGVSGFGRHRCIYRARKPGHTDYLQRVDHGPTVRVATAAGHGLDEHGLFWSSGALAMHSVNALFPLSEEAPQACSFCGKSQTAVRLLIAASETYICDECVVFCKAIVDGYLDGGEERRELAEARGEAERGEGISTEELRSKLFSRAAAAAWTVGADGCFNTSVAFRACKKTVADIMRNRRLGDPIELGAGLIVAALVHEHHLQPGRTARLLASQLEGFRSTAEGVLQSKSEQNVLLVWVSAKFDMLLRALRGIEA